MEAIQKNPASLIGRVVFGPFVTPNGDVLAHFSVVVQATAEGAVLAYTTSLKDDVGRGHMVQRFSEEDNRLAKFAKAARWDAKRVCVVGWAELKLGGSLTKETTEKILAAYRKARATRELVATVYEPANLEHCA